MQELALKAYPVVIEIIDFGGIIGKRDINLGKREAYIEGFKKSSELLYSEEDVRKAIDDARQMHRGCFEFNEDDIVHGLKQQG